MKLPREAGRALSGALAILLLTLATPARGQTVASYEHYESPQRFAFELRFGPYSPSVDSSLGEGSCGAGPYEASFGSGPQFFTELQFDWQAFRFYVGSFGLGVAAGVLHATGHALEPDTCTASTDETALWALPLSLLVTLRFDYLAEAWHIPIVPFFKVGLTYALWFVTGPDGLTGDGQGTTAAGGTAGLRLGGGAMLRLDWIEPRSARTLDNQYGINHSYLFFEWYWAWLDGFGDARRMNLSDSTWVAGLALEF